MTPFFTSSTRDDLLLHPYHPAMNGKLYDSINCISNLQFIRLDLALRRIFEQQHIAAERKEKYAIYNKLAVLPSEKVHLSDRICLLSSFHSLALLPMSFSSDLICINIKDIKI